LTAPLHRQPSPVARVKPPLARDQLPPESPLPFPMQDLSRPFIDPAAPQRLSNTEPSWLRAGVTLATILLTLVFTHQMAVFLSADGLTVFEGLTLAFYVLTFVWIAFAFVNALLGAVVLIGGTDGRPPNPTRPLRVALLILTYKEPPTRVFGNATAMFSNLAEVESHHNYDLFVLSDTNESELIEEEQAAFLAARELLEADWPLYYRRRGQNSNRKVGNIADWICRWGGDYEAFLVLDADSVMSAQAIHALTDELARDETLGLVQSAPRIIGARTLFGRIQQFSSATVGPVVAAGASTWMGAEANYFGHNAIVRTRAFAASASAAVQWSFA
jgi:membrane glycosyltransferase